MFFLTSFLFFVPFLVFFMTFRLFLEPSLSMFFLFQDFFSNYFDYILIVMQDFLGPSFFDILCFSRFSWDLTFCYFFPWIFLLSAFLIYQMHFRIFLISCFLKCNIWRSIFTYLSFLYCFMDSFLLSSLVKSLFKCFFLFGSYFLFLVFGTLCNLHDNCSFLNWYLMALLALSVQQTF